MHQVDYDITEEPGTRNRVTVAFRYLLAIPHLFLVSLWGQVVELAAFIHWFVQVFTGKRNESLWRFSNDWLAYAARVYTYVALQYDQYPAFLNDPGTVPVRYSLEYEEGPVNRVTAGLRVIWVIPAAVISAVLGLVGCVLAVVGWFAILLTGQLSPGLSSMLRRVIRYSLQTQAYGLLLTDRYPKYG